VLQTGNLVEFDHDAVQIVLDGGHQQPVFVLEIILEQQILNQPTNVPKASARPFNDDFRRGDSERCFVRRVFGPGFSPGSAYSVLVREKVEIVRHKIAVRSRSKETGHRIRRKPEIDQPLSLS
jgi:hypothetical protein